MTAYAWQSRITRMRRRFSAVLMHHNLCQQQRLTYIYTNGDPILLMVGSESGIPGSQHSWSGGRFHPPPNSPNSSQGWWTLGEGSQLDVNVGDNNVQFCQGAKCPKPSFITILGPFHHRYALFFYHPKANPSKVAEYLTPFESR